MKVVVTGATGFIGSALLSELVHRGHEVISLYRPKGQQAVQRADVTWVSGELDKKSAITISKFSPDACIHTA
ncbi:MAG: NAD-dependent epimerase/dehydratase family protein, partial [Verrucomicrobiales bacterium]|nr:NAD-dependent epimerase/dehydratase family protein [Verrucomicrobiales bacterium]